MVLNYIWIFFFLVAFVIACVKFIFFGDTEIFKHLVDGTFDSAKTAFEISLGLTGVMTLWLGLMNIGEKAGAINFLSRLVNPFFSRLFPEIPKNHPATGNILMNFSANLLGLSNAATPLGLKAMQSMQDLNTEKETASNSQIMFLVLNTSGFTIIPVSIIVFRTQLGALDPSDVFVPILIATYCSTLIGLLAVCVKQKINLFDKVLLSWVLATTAMVAGVVYYFSTLNQVEIGKASSFIGNFILFAIIIGFIVSALIKKVNAYEVFIEGAKTGFETSIKIIPYMVAMLVGIAVFRASGAMDLLTDGFMHFFYFLGINTDFIPSLPTAFMKPLSGSGARGMMIDSMKTYGVDSFVGRLSCVIQGSADTTFYIIALYFGSVGIKKTRYAITFGLLTDLAGIVAAILVSYLFFH